MKKIIRLTERDLTRIVMKVLNEKVIKKTFINEENMYVDAAKKTIGDNKFFITRQTVTAPETNSNFKLKFFKGVKFTHLPAERITLVTDKKATIQFTTRANEVWSETTKAFIYYDCNTGKLSLNQIENSDLQKQYGEWRVEWYVNDEKLTREEFKLVCQNIKKTGKKDAEKINQEVPVNDASKHICSTDKTNSKIHIGKSYNYCKNGENYYFIGTLGDPKTKYPNWTKAEGKGLEAIKTKIFYK